MTTTQQERDAALVEQVARHISDRMAMPGRYDAASNTLRNYVTVLAREVIETVREYDRDQSAPNL